MKKIGEIKTFYAGISDSPKKGKAGSFAFNRATDFRSDPAQLTTNPKSLKVSGSVVTGLPLWGDRAGSLTYFYDNAGAIYKDTAGTITKEHTAPGSSGNGVAYLGEDRNLYYAQDKTIGKLTEANGTTGSYFDGFLESEGGEPTNTHSVDFELGSSQYASVADHADQSLTGDISMEAYIKPESLPTGTDTMTVVGKWNETGNQRSYKLAIGTESNYFGDGSDGPLVISTNQTEAPIDSACTGTAGTNTLSATNVNFAAGQKVLLHQTQGTNAGQQEFGTIQSYTAGTITLDANLIGTYTTGAQVRVLKQYTDVTINTGITWTAKAWNGTTGGILRFFCNGTFTNNGIIYGTGKGFRGGAGVIGPEIMAGAQTSYSGEGTAGASSTNLSPDPNGNGAGANKCGTDGNYRIGGSGGGNATNGSQGGIYNAGGRVGAPGSASGSNELTSESPGGGGSGAVKNTNTQSNQTCGSGGEGGAIIEIDALTFVNSGYIYNDGVKGGNGTIGGGGGAGGCIGIKCQTATLGTGTILARGGAAGIGSTADALNGAAGANGRISIDYYTSYTGTTTPSIYATQNNSLGSVDGYNLRLYISANGTALEYMKQTALLEAGKWYRVGVTWDASASLATFYLNGTNIGTDVGALTAIYNSTAIFSIAADANGHYFDGRMDDVRLWSDVRTDSEILSKMDTVLAGTEANLVSYYKLDNNYNDSTSLVHHMTGTNTPVFSTEVPFSGVTTRGDEDQSSTGAGNTYAVPVAINEAAAHRQTFIPAKDPQKSISINVNTKGTGDWTITVHDAQNRTIATSTVAIAQLLTGTYEFTWSSVWRPIIGASYHFHVTSTVNDGVLVSTANNDMEGTTVNTGAQYHTYYQILVDDQYHPMMQHLNVVAIGNERYLATLEAGNIYDPHRLVFPSGYRVRCLAFYREYLAIGTWMGTNITDYDKGRIFFWDGTASTYNFFIDVPEGGINTMYGNQSMLNILAGYEGQLLQYSGGDKAIKKENMPLLNPGEYVEFAPGSMNMWRTLLVYGGVLNTDSETVHKGIYTYGSINDGYPDALGFDYPLSLGDQTISGVKVGMVFPAGQSLYIGWQNLTAFGIDKITATNDPYDTSTIELLITDFDQLAGQKLPLVFRADFEPLVTGQSVVLKMKTDREGSWKTLQTQSTVGATDCRSPIHVNGKEAQFACDITNTTESVKITGFTLEVEGNDSERTV